MPDQVELAKQWVAQGEPGRRSVTITVGAPGESSKFEIFAYDYDLSVGQIAKDMFEVNIEEKAKLEARKDLDRARRILGL